MTTCIGRMLPCVFWVIVSACGGKETPLPKAAADVPDVIVPPQGVGGWNLQVEAVLGRESNAPVAFSLRIAGDLWSLSFPANGILPGMQLRVAPGRITLVDPGTARRARLSGRRFDPLGDSGFHTTVFSGPVQQKPDGSWNLRFFARTPEGGSSFHELDLIPGRARQFPPVRDVSSFLLRRLPVQLPACVLDIPVSRWEWRDFRGTRTGISRFTILGGHPARLMPEDLMHDIPGHAARSPLEILPRAVQDPHSRLPLVATGERSGLLFVNGSPRGILIPGQLAAPGLPVAEIQLIPLLGGVSVWEGTIRGSHVWTISR